MYLNAGARACKTLTTVQSSINNQMENRGGRKSVKGGPWGKKAVENSNILVLLWGVNAWLVGARATLTQHMLEAQHVPSQSLFSCWVEAKDISALICLS